MIEQALNKTNGAQNKRLCEVLHKLHNEVLKKALMITKKSFVISAFALFLSCFFPTVMN